LNFGPRKRWDLNAVVSQSSVSNTLNWTFHHFLSLLYILRLHGTHVVETTDHLHEPVCALLKIGNFFMAWR
jgi:hypothetical protein